jgi:16S rRNA (cytosine1402-N4)-methyltransferase
LANIFFKYGDEKRSRKIARAIVERRVERALTTTKELADLIAATLGWREKSQHPATRCFQALRIYVNKELEELEQGLAAAIEMIKPGGRLVVISFHSLEDRIVKHFFHPPKKELLPGIPLEMDRAELPFTPVGKPIKPSLEEVSVNPRSRSAIMRVGVRT